MAKRGAVVTYRDNTVHGSAEAKERGGKAVGTQPHGCAAEHIHDGGIDNGRILFGGTAVVADGGDIGGRSDKFAPVFVETHGLDRCRPYVEPNRARPAGHFSASFSRGGFAQRIPRWD
jgi:hypothetical protein